MNTFQIGVSVDSIDAAVAASRTGISYLQLCSALCLGGLTPQSSLLALVKERLSLPLHILIRPRQGNFLYTPLECEQMKRDLMMCRKHMVDGIIINALSANGTLDTYMLRTLIELADGMTVILGRCFDLCKDPLETLETAISLGFDGILTSGQKQTALLGVPLLETLTTQSRGRIHIIPTGGIDASCVADILTRTSPTHLLVSAYESSPSLMSYHNPELSLMKLPIDENESIELNESKLSALKHAIDTFSF